MMRPTLSISDLKLRLFIDSCVLIDFLENIDNNKARTFINLLKNQNFEYIELVTSDYVLWELYNHFKRDFYMRKMICEKNLTFKQAWRGIREYIGASQSEMNTIGQNIKELINQLDEINIHTTKLMNREKEGFSETIEYFLQYSKFSYEDTLILVSSLFTNSNMMITIDQQFRDEASRISEIREERQSLPPDFLENSGFINLKFETPEQLSTENKIKRKYKDWFKYYNKDKVIGKVVKCWKRSKTLAIECFKDYTIKEGDYLYLIKFSPSNDFIKKSLKIGKNCLKDHKRKNIKEGKKVTVKCPQNFSFSDINLTNSMVFISE